MQSDQHSVKKLREQQQIMIPSITKNTIKMFVSNDERFDHYFTIGIPEGMNNALGVSGLSRHGISISPALGQMMAAATDDRLFLQHK
jgi:glycine/D-amino acid oxidase-like deaminating enzyme